jgi:hypothetical protein|nr:MAG TPA: hypothetical protein [Crassvirales sp.]
MEQTLIKQVFDNFDIIYILMINIVTYFLIKTADYFNGDKKVPVLTKRIFLIIAIIIMFCIYKYNDYSDSLKLINSSIAAPVIWTWVLKPIINKLKIGYKNENNN